MSVLSLKDIRFRYKGAVRPVLDGLSLELGEGEAAIVSGPSGGGKTTLCLVCLAIIPNRVAGDFEGKAEIMGKDTVKLGPQGVSEYAGCVMQEPEYSMIMPTTEEEIAFGLENRNWPPAEIEERVERLMGDMGLRELSGRSPHRLSGGEKQALAISAAVAPNPRLLILDEAFSGLDDGKRVLIGEKIAAMKNAGVAVLLVEHEGIGREEHPWVDRRLVLKDGVLSEALL